MLHCLMGRAAGLRPGQTHPSTKRSEHQKKKERKKKHGPTTQGTKPPVRKKYRENWGLKFTTPLINRGESEKCCLEK